MINGTTGELWCGIHEDEADLRDFIAGMGYQNMMCQRAFSPMYTNFNPATQAIDLAFVYFNHTEPEFDYTHVYILCYDAADELIEEHTVATFDGIRGDYQIPATYDEGVEVPAGTLPTETATVQVEFRMTADGGWSDEDGLWDTPCGPFAADDVAITVGPTHYDYDFDDGAQGWTFDKCEGAGAWMHIVHDYEYQEWLDDLGLICDCTLVGDAIGFVATMCSNGPGLVPGLHEQFETGVVPRAGYPAPQWNAAVIEFDAYVNFPYSTGAFYRPGWRKYPHTTEANPVPHWSGRKGQATWLYSSGSSCGLSRINLSTMDNAPLPVEWDSVKFVYEIWCSCDAFSTPTSVCVDEGCTGGAPVLDNFRLGLIHKPNAPGLAIIDGGFFMDGYGQNYPTYLEPADRGNANISFDLSMSNLEKNDWHGDSTVVLGPSVSSEATRFLCETCFRVPRVGPRQYMIPEYHVWKARLTGDPEAGFVCVLMDSLETNNHTNISKNRFGTYFHEDDPGFDPAYPDYRPNQEILPDGVFVPGTRIEYYFRAHWYNGGAPPADYTIMGPLEFAILPTMTLAPGEEYTVVWPSVLYVDAYNRGRSERYIGAVLAAAGLSFDRFDYLDAAGCCNASLRRSFGGTGYNPGGYGNNGLTLEQLCGYRVVLFSLGLFGVGSTEDADWTLFEDWLATTDCGLANVRRGLILDGNEICALAAGPAYPVALDFANNVLGVDYVANSYRTYNSDPSYCVYLEPSQNAVFSPAQPGIGLLGNGCPQLFNYNVLGVHAGVPDALGNLRFYSYQGTGTQTYVDYAQVVRQNVQPGVTNWMSVMNGFSLYYLSERGYGGEDCSADSAARVAGGLALLQPMLGWMEDPGDPFEPWRYPCVDTSVEEPPATHLSGSVDHLYPARPSPFHARATLRFTLAQTGRATLELFDVSGRKVRTLLDGPRAAGEQTIVWDGTDDGGRRLGAGLYWMQLRTERGYASSRRLLALP